MVVEFDSQTQALMEPWLCEVPALTHYLFTTICQWYIYMQRGREKVVVSVIYLPLIEPFKP